MERSSDGSFCSRIEHDGEVFEYTNETQNNFPIYSSGEYLLAQDNDDVERGIKGAYRVFPTATTRDANAGEKKFDPTCARCDRISSESMPATSIHARWYLPRGSLTEATTWELGMTIKVLNSYLHTYFMTVTGLLEATQEYRKHRILGKELLESLRSWHCGIQERIMSLWSM